MMVDNIKLEYMEEIFATQVAVIIPENKIYFNLIERENSFDKIDGEWVEKVTGIKCKSYNGE